MSCPLTTSSTRIIGELTLMILLDSYSKVVAEATILMEQLQVAAQLVGLLPMHRAIITITTVDRYY
jgi:hypothetical protein